LRAIARGTGAEAVSERWYFEARTADEREARHLQIQVGDPVLAQASVWSAQDGTPVEYREAVVACGEVISGTTPVDLGL
jgi:DNA-binding GntR family transcriptional regulator